jgi:hypothetical protein
MTDSTQHTTAGYQRSELILGQTNVGTILDSNKCDYDPNEELGDIKTDSVN